jgi:hypothetical protein
MALRDSRLFRFSACALSGLSIACFMITIVMRVMHGKGTEIYLGGRGLPIPNIAALVAIIAVALTLVVALCLRAWQKRPDPRIRNRDD